MTTSMFVRKTWGAALSTNPPVTTASIFVPLAEANTSAGAPCWIWVTSVCEPAKLNVTVTPGLAASKACPISLKASVREAAANTFSVRGSGRRSWNNCGGLRGR